MDKKKEQYSLNDDSRIRALSPGALVAKRFFRNKLAVVGLSILLVMFVFSFIGGIITPYEQDQKFYRTNAQEKDYAGILHNEEFRYTIGDPELYKSSVNGQVLKNIMQENESFRYNDHDYTLTKLSDSIYTVSTQGKVVAIASKELIDSSTTDKLSFEFMVAALTAYPELGCTGGPYKVWQRWGITQDILCAGNDQVFDFLEGVFTELMDIFPSEYIHIGGDECFGGEGEGRPDPWDVCPKCAARMKALGIKKGPDAKHYLQSYFTARMQQFLADHGRKLIGWDEILEGDKDQ